MRADGAVLGERVIAAVDGRLAVVVDEPRYDRVVGNTRSTAAFCSGPKRARVVSQILRLVLHAARGTGPRQFSCARGVGGERVDDAAGGGEGEVYG